MSAWLIAYEKDRSLSEATNAVHHIGTNALPLLVKWMSYKVPPWREALNDVAYRLGGSPLFRFVAGSSAARQSAALLGFEILGPEAAPAIPALTNLLSDWNWKWRGNFQNAGRALRYMGNAGLAPLVSVVTNKSAPADYRFSATVQIEEATTGWGTNANWAVPVLIRSLDDRQVAPLVAMILGDLRLEPALAVPALAKCLQNHDRLTALNAAESLGKFGTNATVAIPDLIQALDSEDTYVRAQATNALKRIAPEVLKKDGH